MLTLFFPKKLSTIFLISDIPSIIICLINLANFLKVDSCATTLERWDVGPALPPYTIHGGFHLYIAEFSALHFEETLESICNILYSIRKINNCTCHYGSSLFWIHCGDLLFSHLCLFGGTAKGKSSPVLGTKSFWQMSVPGGNIHPPWYTDTPNDTYLPLENIPNDVEHHNMHQVPQDLQHCRMVQITPLID